MTVNHAIADALSDARHECICKILDELIATFERENVPMNEVLFALSCVLSKLGNQEAASLIEQASSLKPKS